MMQRSIVYKLLVNVTNIPFRHANIGLARPLGLRTRKTVTSLQQTKAKQSMDDLAGASDWSHRVVAVAVGTHHVWVRPNNANSSGYGAIQMVHEEQAH